MIYTINSLRPICAILKSKGRRIVLATGFFDLLHQEHQNFLVKAKSLGDVLIVGVESNTRARELKGEGRPIQSQTIRCQMILEAGLADYVIALSDSFNSFRAYDSLMAKLLPDIYAVSSHTSHQRNKQFLTEKYGGKLVVAHEFNPDISTTKIINERNQL